MSKASLTTLNISNMPVRYAVQEKRRVVGAAKTDFRGGFFLIKTHLVNKVLLIILIHLMLWKVIIEEKTVLLGFFCWSEQDSYVSTLPSMVH